MSTLRAAILHHAPDPATKEADFAAPHFDFLLETEHSEPGLRDVPTWRTPTRIDGLAPLETEKIERIQDHRTDWLDQTDTVQLDAGRGIVTPVAHGRVRILSKNDQAWLIEVDWKSAGSVRYRI
ncbi:MAG: hypothetical protein MK085_07535, partial [Phycisphaerales bacterium]|nr:hypothetical protein [Phycisphaerales bacterium]